jgi:serine phosphatase RsbU (regulator of sigma subunit)
VIARNNTVPVFMVARDRIDCLSAESVPIGNVRNIHPSICELPLESDLTVVVFTDGLMHAGQAYGKSLDFNTTLEALLIDQDNPQDLPSPQDIADALLSNAIRLDEGHPEDDMSVVVLRSLEQNRDDVRRMVINLPVNLRS